jgi:type IV pilus assembly protein PilQ
MKLHPILFGSALAAFAAQPGMAAVTSITEVSLNPTDTGLEVIFETEGGDNSNVFTVNQGNTLVADITRTQLDLPNGGGFLQANPAPGISQISVAPLDANSVRVTISGTSQTPIGSVVTTDNRVVLSISNDGEAASTPTPVPQDLVTVPAPAASASLAQATPLEPAEVPTPASPEVLVPNPEIIIDGNPVPQPQERPAPPFLPRAVAPPVGDIAIAEGQIIGNTIDLGSNERIPKLLLRDAPAREVLSLLARAAGLNLIFTPGDGAAGGQEQAGGAGDGHPVSLDIENESVQDVFNHVLRVTGLQANRVGRSIYVGPQLPDGARNIVSRTLRLNQATAIEVSGFLASLGAEATQTVVRADTETIEIPSTEEGGVPIRRITEFETTTIEQLTFPPAAESFVAQPLRGLQVIVDNRLNSVTLVGEADLVSLGSEYLSRLDLRLRQVAVNVKIIDLNLAATENFGTSFTYLNNGLSIGFGGGGLQIGDIGNPPNALAQGLLVQIDAAIRNKNAKILTDPTLVVQEGQTSSVALVESVLTSLVTTVSPDTGVVTSITPVFEDAGLILQIQVERIDDNGFVTFNIAPSISSPQPPITFRSAAGDQDLTPISRREVSSGSIRVRDGQTLVVAGIISESETASTTKIPILGDLPILGALFRSTETTGRRNEVVILLTPQILDDSDQSVFGYSYTPSEEVQEILDNRQ